jgi:hypothetical protein
MDILYSYRQQLPFDDYIWDRLLKADREVHPKEHWEKFKLVLDQLISYNGDDKERYPTDEDRFDCHYSYPLRLANVHGVYDDWFPLSEISQLTVKEYFECQPCVKVKKMTIWHNIPKLYLENGVEICSKLKYTRLDKIFYPVLFLSHITHI